MFIVLHKTPKKNDPIVWAVRRVPYANRETGREIEEHAKTTNPKTDKEFVPKRVAPLAGYVVSGFARADYPEGRHERGMM